MGIYPRNKHEDSSAIARRRRKAKLTCKNASEKRLPEGTPEEVLSVERKKPHITGIKKQSRYDPGVPMTRSELTVWRKEARRVRNRQSAAESRRRTRDRIEELEGKLSSLEEKYSAALKRISELEGCQPSTHTQSHIVSQECLVETGTESNAPKHIPDSTSMSTPVVSPTMSPISSPKPSPRTIDLREDHSNHFSEEVAQCQHINMISRPPA